LNSWECVQYAEIQNDHKTLSLMGIPYLH